MNKSDLTNLNKIHKNLFLRAYKEIILSIFFGIGFTSLILVYSQSLIRSDRIASFLILTSWFPLFYFFNKIINNGGIIFWKHVASVHNLEFFESKEITNKKALLFQFDEDKILNYSISGIYHEHPFSLFQYDYYRAANAGARASLMFIVFQITCRGVFPHIYLDNRRNRFTNKLPSLSKLAQIHLPTEFTNRFILYAPAQYEIEVLEIFTPDILQKLVDLDWDFDIEIVDGELIIFHEKTIKSIEQLEKELEYLKKCIDIFSPVLKKVSFKQIGDISPYLGRDNQTN